MSALEIVFIFLGGFLGSFVSIAVKYGVAKGEFKKAGNYVFAAILSFAIYWLYYFLTSAGYLAVPFSNLALFGMAVFLGFAIDELARGFMGLIKK
jgi:hypothetical protein